MAWIDKFKEHPEEAMEFLNQHTAGANQGAGSGKGYHFVGVNLQDLMVGLHERFYGYGWTSGQTLLRDLLDDNGAINLEFSSVKAGRWAESHAAELVTQIEDTTRNKLRDIIAKSVQEEQPWQIIKDRLKESYEFSDRRAETIARTESALAYNTGAVSCWEESGVVQYVHVTDGDYCDTCRHIDGQTWTLAEARKRPIEHPNCWREFYPIPNYEGETE